MKKNNTITCTLSQSLVAIAYATGLLLFSAGSFAHGCDSNLVKLCTPCELCGAKRFHAVARFAVSVKLLPDFYWDNPQWRSWWIYEARGAIHNITAWKIMCDHKFENFWENGKFAASFTWLQANMHSASGGTAPRPSDQRLCPWTQLGALPLYPCDRLALPWS